MCVRSIFVLHAIITAPSLGDWARVLDCLRGLCLPDSEVPQAPQCGKHRQEASKHWRFRPKSQIQGSHHPDPKGPKYPNMGYIRFLPRTSIDYFCLVVLAFRYFWAFRCFRSLLRVFAGVLLVFAGVLAGFCGHVAAPGHLR